MNKAKYIYPFLLFMLLISCKSEQNTKGVDQNINLAADGFNIEDSDPVAIKIADQVMEAMGGRSAYDESRYLGWNFFGSRKHIWDKQTGNVRIESQKDDFSLVMNIHNLEGKVKKDGALMSHPDSLSKYLQKGKEMWINDAYWLIMPFKLKDSGVTLTDLGEEKTDSTDYRILGLTFENVGVTPDNKYHIFVDKQTNLITQWSFYRNATDSIPGFTTPWTDYKQYGKILLSGNRGKYQLSDIEIMESVPDGTFTEL